MLVAWILIGILAVTGAKYYTAMGTRRLERRMGSVRTEFQRAKNRLQEVKKAQSTMVFDEEISVERIRVMRDMIHDLKARLSTGDAREKASDRSARVARARRESALVEA